MSFASTSGFSREAWATFIASEFPSNKAAAGFFGKSVRTVEYWLDQTVSPDADSIMRARYLQGASRFFGFDQ